MHREFNQWLARSESEESMRDGKGGGRVARGYGNGEGRGSDRRGPRLGSDRRANNRGLSSRGASGGGKGKRPAEVSKRRVSSKSASASKIKNSSSDHELR